MSASAGNNLPWEITEAILHFLPAKSLGRFKSVSKRWNSLISDPQFIKTHLLHRHGTSKLIGISYTRCIYSLDISQCVNESHGLSASGKEVGLGSPLIQLDEILGSCNGLVLATDVKETRFLINPTTREVWEIPLPPFAIPDKDGFVMCGFGYDLATDDYKVVWVSWDPHNDPDDDGMHVIVYSLRNNSWRKLPNVPYYLPLIYALGGALVNQNCHWLARTRGSSLMLILAFSLASEEFYEIKLPVSLEHEGDLDCDLVVGGKLVVFFSNGMGYGLWVMEEYGVAESWTRICIYGVEMGYIKPVCLVEGSNRDIVLDDLNYREVVVYNMDERRCKNVRITGGPGRSRFSIGGVYVETLESPRRITTPP